MRQHNYKVGPNAVITRWSDLAWPVMFVRMQDGALAAVGLTVLAVKSEVGLADIPYCVGVRRDIEIPNVVHAHQQLPEEH